MDHLRNIEFCFHSSFPVYHQKDTADHTEGRRVVFDAHEDNRKKYVRHQHGTQKQIRELPSELTFYNNV